MITINSLLARALQIMTAVLRKENTALRVGSLLRDIIYFLQNLVLGIILKGDQANEAAIKALPSPTRGDTWKAIDTGHYWTYDGTNWNDIGNILPSDVMLSGDSSKTGQQLDNEKLASSLNINIEKSDVVTNLISSGLKAFSIFRMVLFKGFENTEYFIYGIYNAPFASEIPLFKVGKINTSGSRSQVTSAKIQASASNPAYVQSNQLHRVYLNDGGGYIEFAIDMAVYGGYNPATNIAYLNEIANKKLIIRPSSVVSQMNLYKRPDLEYYRDKCYTNTGDVITGSGNLNRKAAIYPIEGNTKPIKFTTYVDTGLPPLVFYDKNMNFITYFEDSTVNRKYSDYTLPYTGAYDNPYPAFSKAAYVAINGYRGYEMSLFIGDTQQSDFKLRQVNTPASFYRDGGYWNDGGLFTTGFPNLCAIEINCTQKDVIAISQYLDLPAGPMVVYKDASGNVINLEQGYSRKDYDFYYLTIPPNAVKACINGMISTDRIKFFVSGDTYKYIDRQFQSYNKQNTRLREATNYGIDGIAVTGDVTKSAVKYRCYQEEEFLISTVTSGIVPLIVVLDVYNNVIEYKENPTTETNRTFTDYYYKIPINGFWLLVNGTTINPINIRRKSVEPVFKSDLSDISSGIQLLWIYGKRVLWLGTSIPSGGQYPQMSCSALGATCINQSLGASKIRLGEQSPTMPIASDGSDLYRMGSLIETIAEKKTIWLDTGMCTQAQFDNYAKSASYETKLLPYLSGANKVDLVVIDHGFNDRADSVLGDVSDIVGKDKTKFIGAMSALISIIRDIDFRMRIMICTHYDNTMNAFNAHNLCAAQELIGDRLGVDVFSVYKHSGLSNQWIAGTSGLYPEYQRYDENPVTGDLTLLQCWMPDGYHPHSDTTGKTQKMLTDIHIINLKMIR